MLLIKESVLSLKIKTTHHWFSYFQIARKNYNIFYRWPFDIILTILVYDN